MAGGKGGSLSPEVAAAIMYNTTQVQLPLLLVSVGIEDAVHEVHMHALLVSS